jgi:hypothetical protein
VREFRRQSSKEVSQYYTVEPEQRKATKDPYREEAIEGDEVGFEGGHYK